MHIVCERVSCIIREQVSRDIIPKRDQISFAKAIVGRRGKDDNWVIGGIAGCTFAAATPQTPEESARPVRLDRLRQVNHDDPYVVLQKRGRGTPGFLLSLHPTHIISNRSVKIPIQGPYEQF